MTDARPKAERGDQSLPRNLRIAKRRDFLRIYERGTKQHARYAVVFALPNDLGHPRIGVTATKRLGRAHTRNLYKRWVREVFRRERYPGGLSACSLDFVVNLKTSALDIAFAEFHQDLAGALRKAMRAAQGAGISG